MYTNSPNPSALRLLLVPALLLAPTVYLARAAQPDFLLGLSSDFYAGATAGFGACTMAFVLVKLVRDATAARQ
jgi:hypothetical protein